MGLLVDAVNQVIDLRSDQIEPVPTFGTAVRVELLRGLGTIGSKFVLLLDLGNVLSPDDLLAQAATLATAAEPLAVATEPTAAGPS